MKCFRCKIFHKTEGRGGKGQYVDSEKQGKARLILGEGRNPLRADHIPPAKSSSHHSSSEVDECYGNGEIIKWQKKGGKTKQVQKRTVSIGHYKKKQGGRHIVKGRTKKA